jgi:hypothetical protein
MNTILSATSSTTSFAVAIIDLCLFRHADDFAHHECQGMQVGLLHISTDA